MRLGPHGHVLAIDRSPRAIEQLVRGSGDLIDAGRLSARVAAVEDLVLAPGEQPYDLAFAVRVGVLDGRHPAQFDRALACVAAMLVPDGRLFIDGGDPLVELTLPR